MRGTRAHRLRRSKRGVLEGLPLSLLISIFIIAVGAAILIGIYEYAQTVTLSTITVATPGVAGPFPGFLSATPTQLEVNALSKTHGPLGGVQVILNGSGVSLSSVTAANGSVFFWIEPVFREHATSGVLQVTATYQNGVSFSSSPVQSYALSIPVLS
jgi:hypothetical protein